MVWRATVVMARRGYGKLILFGEHFVVYKVLAYRVIPRAGPCRYGMRDSCSADQTAALQVPALVGAVADYTECTVTLTPGGSGISGDDDRPAVPGYKVEKKDEHDEAVKLVLKHMNCDFENQGVEVKFGGNLTCVSGIGASAAATVSLARAVATAQGRSLSEEEINQAGYEGEKGYHGTPSGIDNTAATYGGVLRFQRTDGDPIFVTKKLKTPVEIVYASTGITASTSKVVADVRAKKEADEAWFANLIGQYQELVEKGEKALDDADWTTLGQLLNENHTLCQSLTVSCKELDTLVDAARAAGAIGAKMSGTGRGGLMLALTPGKESQDKVAAALTAAGAAQVWKTCFS